MVRRGHSIKGERIYKVEYSNKPADCYCYAIYAPRVGMYGGRWNSPPPLPRQTLLQIRYKFNMINLKSMIGMIGDLITRKTNSYIPRLKYTHPLPSPSCLADKEEVTNKYFRTSCMVLLWIVYPTF